MAQEVPKVVQYFMRELDLDPDDLMGRRLAYVFDQLPKKLVDGIELALEPKVEDPNQIGLFGDRGI